jgi:hypothetical protein
VVALHALVFAAVRGPGSRFPILHKPEGRDLRQATGWAHSDPAGEVHAMGMLNSNEMAAEERDYATCEASFETKSGYKSRTGAGCRGIVSVASGGRIRRSQRAGGGYGDVEEHYTAARDYTR